MVKQGRAADVLAIAQGFRTLGCIKNKVDIAVFDRVDDMGPPLEHFAQRAFIAGEVTNEPQYLIRWIEVPQAIEPGTAMPNLGVSEGQARSIAAYLYTLR